ncbi:hypothetical protein FZEAL_915 [Fusarium zealandicum]|uniref:Beta-lactamase-related domain-containing protein n=1 Tax=Fusarium zealandicum TaxID=1053134 RepID=A0A8H4UUI1_9HYPO|nr:hypothetical protein FZEAL_915 [Fusarium zealandicum]
MSPIRSFIHSLSLALPLDLSNFKCCPEGPVLPRPTAISDSPVFKEAAANLTQTLDAAVSVSTTSGWLVDNVSFSMIVISASQDKSGVPIWEYHHLASANDKGTKYLNRDSQYLIGSVSKVITEYVLLKSDVDSDSPVTKFLPRLNDSESLVPWGEVSLRMLVSYLGGTPANWVIPPSDSSWGADYKENIPAGGLVSSLSDLSKFSNALLSRSINLTSTEIDAWLKLAAFAGNAYTMTGMPWEILHPVNSPPEHPHSITIYRKSGGARSCCSQLSFVEDYGIAVFILTAGPVEAAPILTDACFRLL